MSLVAMNLGLGDAFICNGLIRELSKSHDHLEIPCWPHNHDTVGWMLSDLKNVTVKVVTSEDDLTKAAHNTIRLGHYGKDFRQERFDESFYHQASIPFLHRWSSFHAPRGDRQLVKYGDYIVVHDDVRRGFSIAPYRLPDLPIVRLEGRSNMLDYLTLLENAVEIHCINSSLLCLVDSLELDVPLFFHYYPRPTVFPVLGRQWQILT